jgi:hypothetical protein
VSRNRGVRGVGLEGDDVLVGNSLSLGEDIGRSSEDCGEQSSKSQSEAADASHDEQRDTRGDEAVWMRIVKLIIVVISKCIYTQIGMNTP